MVPESSARPIAVSQAALPSGITGPVRVVIEDDRIIAVETAVSTDGVADVLLIPGLVDLQVNGAGQNSVGPAAASDHRWSELEWWLVRHGTTAWLPTLTTSSPARLDGDLDALTPRVSTGNAAFGIHLEGPGLGSRSGAHPVEHLMTIDAPWARALPSEVRLVTLGAEQPHSREVVETLVAGGRTVAIGHTAAATDRLDAARAGGATLVTHLYNAMSGLHHRDPGVVGWALTTDDIAVSIIADLDHVAAEAIDIAFRCKADGTICLVSDTVAWASPGLHRPDPGHAARLADGTLAGATIPLLAGVVNLVTRCGISLDRALRSATKSPAAIVGATDRGRIEVGARADLVALDRHLAVQKVWMAGRTARPRRY